MKQETISVRDFCGATVWMFVLHKDGNVHRRQITKRPSIITPISAPGGDSSNGGKGTGGSLGPAQFRYQQSFFAKESGKEKNAN